jgi:VWFA-related protein
MMRLGVVRWMLAGAALGTLSMHAQVATATTLQANATLVLVPALVRNAESASTPVLRARDFLLTDNGVAQTARIDDTERQPLSILVVLQIGGDALRQFGSYRTLGTMVANLARNPASEVSLLTFDSQPEELYDFAPGVAGLEDELKSPAPGDHGAAVLDAVNAGIDALRVRPAGKRRVLLLISQEHDEGSVAKDNDIVRRLGESNITIESLSFSPEKDWLKDQFTKERHENKPYQFSPDMPLLLHTFNLDVPLREAIHAMRENTGATVAKLSGGEAFAFDTKRGVDGNLAELANDFAATYMLSFRPSSTQSGLHTLRVSVPAHPEFTVSARSSYWMEPGTMQ